MVWDNSLIFPNLASTDKAVKIVRAFRIRAFVYHKVLTVLLWNKYVGTMRTAEFVGFGKSVILRRRMKIEANLTTYLTFLSAIVSGQIRFGSIADRAGAVIGYITFGSAEHRLYGFAVTRFVVRNEVVPFPILFIGNDAGKYIYFEFLIFRGMRIIKSPLLEWDVFTDKI